MPTVDELELPPTKTFQTVRSASRANEIRNFLSGMVTALRNGIGSDELSDLSTTDQTSIIAAVNELHAMIQVIDPDATGGVTADEVAYERLDASKKNVLAASDDVEAALTDIDDAVGALADLNTTDQASVVAAINEVESDAAAAQVDADAAQVDATQALANAATAQAAVDAVEAQVGVTILASLTTTDKTGLQPAINEVDASAAAAQVDATQALADAAAALTAANEADDTADAAQTTANTVTTNLAKVVSGTATIALGASSVTVAIGAAWDAKPTVAVIMQASADVTLTGISRVSWDGAGNLTIYGLAASTAAVAVAYMVDGR